MPVRGLLSSPAPSESGTPGAGRGADTSFLLRNVINRTGVEVQFFVCSPHVRDIKVLSRAGGRGSEGRPGTRMRRAKLFYLRDAPDKMTAISAGMRK